MPNKKEWRNIVKTWQEGEERGRMERGEGEGEGGRDEWTQGSPWDGVWMTEERPPLRNLAQEVRYDTVLMMLHARTS